MVIQVVGGPFPGSDGPPRGSRARPPGQGLEQVVEETGAQRPVHPLAGEERVVHLVHAPDVARAVLLLGLQPRCDVCSGGGDGAL